MASAQETLRDAVVATLSDIFDPCSVAIGSPISVLDLGLIEALEVGAEGDVALTLIPTSPACTLIASIMQSVEERLRTLEGVSCVAVTLKPAALWSEARMSAGPRAELAARRQRMRALIRHPALDPQSEI